MSHNTNNLCSHEIFFFPTSLLDNQLPIAILILPLLIPPTSLNIKSTTLSTTARQSAKRAAEIAHLHGRFNNALPARYARTIKSLKGSQISASSLHATQLLAIGESSSLAKRETRVHASTSPGVNIASGDVFASPAGRKRAWRRLCTLHTIN